MAEGSATHTPDREATVVQDVVYLKISIPIYLATRALIFVLGKAENLLLILGVLERVAGVEDAEVVDILDIALTKVQTSVESLSEEVKSVERFGLGFGNWRNAGRSRESLVSREGSSGILDDDSFFVFVGSGLVMEQRTFEVGFLGISETVRKHQSYHQRLTIEPDMGSILTFLQPSLQLESQ